MRSNGPSGPAPRLSDQQLAEVEQALLAGATASGFVGELWTVDRVALVIERLPAYAPDLNPVEGLWSSLKAVELANLTPPALAEVIQQAYKGIERVRRTPHLAYSFRATPACRSPDPYRPDAHDSSAPPAAAAGWSRGSR